MRSNASYSVPEGALAVIGMAGQFPGAKDVREFWHNIVHSIKSIQTLSDETIAAAGVPPDLLHNPNYVKRAAILDDIDLFDAAFFGFTPREAETIDPQTRLFLQCAWTALENAGYNPETFDGLIGTFAGKGSLNYMWHNLATNPDLIELVGDLQITIHNENDSLAPIVAYRMDLKGPSVSVQSFCSTSLLATHLACQSLSAYECDIAIAGGVAISSLPQETGYLYQEGGILSADGECRSFDAKADGSVMGSAVGIVVLKRLEEAIEDGDTIYAVIRGSATNNDGIMRVGYTAPGLNGQAAVISEALGAAGIDADTVTYVVTHGTGTPLGDSIELEAMIQAFTMQTDKTGFCAITSVKPNVGHLDRASGVANLIKTTMALHHKVLPPSLNFVSSSPEIDLDHSPFYVNTECREWQTNGLAPRRAGTSSFGLGGTNVHMVLEEAPPIISSSDSRPYQLLLLSARTKGALEIMTSNMADLLQENATVNMADVAFTLQRGRASFNHRRAVVCADAADGATALSMADPRRVFTVEQTSRDRSVVFMFPGVGDHYIGMGFDLYQTEPTFRHWVDECCQLLQPYLQCDLRRILYPDNYQEIKTQQGQPDLRRMLSVEGEAGQQAGPLQHTKFAQPAVFVVEYALAQLLMEWGLKPKGLIGYSLGEYTAACLAGVLSLTDAVKLVAERAQRIDALAAGSMLTVALSETAVRPYLNDQISLAGVLTPTTCVLSGPAQHIADLNQRLLEQDIACRLLPTNQAFHSTMMETLVSDIEELVRTVTLHPPQIPYLSNLTGDWITNDEATDPAYWGKHMCQTVRLADSLGVLLQNKDYLLLEVGPGQSLGAFARQHPTCEMSQGAMILPTLPYHYDGQSSSAFLLTTLGKTWLAGVSIDWAGFYTHEFRHRLPLPPYPFERQRYWVERNAAGLTPAVSKSKEGKKADIAEWFYLPTWKQIEIGQAPNALMENIADSTWLLFADECGLGHLLAERLVDMGGTVAIVQPGAHFSVNAAAHEYTINPQDPQQYQRLLRSLPQMPMQIIHLWGVNRSGEEGDKFAQIQDVGFYSFLNLIKAIETYPDSLHIWAITSHAQVVTGMEEIDAEKATIAGICRVIAQENLNISTHVIDVVESLENDLYKTRLVDRLVAEIGWKTNELAVAYRGNTRWTQVFAPVYLDKPTDQTVWRQQGVYLIVGGLGEVGMVIGQHLAQTQQGRLVLTSRSPFPERQEWDNWLSGHDEDNRISQRIRQFMMWETSGAQVWVVQADAVDAEQISQLLTGIDARFGGLHGVLYAAGISGDMYFVPVNEITKDACEAHFQSKAHGLYVLEEALSDRQLDFCVIFSSVSSVLGGLGFAGYAAANNFIDVFTHRHNRQSAQWWTTVNWDTWRTRDDLHEGMGATVAVYDMTPAEAIEALERVIYNRQLTQIVDSTGDLETRIDQWVRMLSVSQAEGGTTETAVSYPRPELMTAYVPPTNDTEKLIAEIWQVLLGIEPVGIYDNFLELGGHSLLAIQVISRLRKLFQVHVPLALILSSPTVADLALAVEMAIIEELESLPDDVVSAQL